MSHVQRYSKWVPELARHDYSRRPEVGWLIAKDFAVWAVTGIREEPMTDEEKAKWIADGMPDSWRDAPYSVNIDFVGGRRPVIDGEVSEAIEFHVIVRPMTMHVYWYVYPDRKWPQCSCCGEPMPCTTTIQDRYVKYEAKRLEKLSARQEGCCWDCGEPISTRQRSVVYDGPNLDLPAGPEVAFHLRRQCLWAARRYEERWVNADPRHERMLTWPSCDGMLVVHGDGSSECRPVSDGEQAGDCEGHLSHDHSWLVACYPRCPRGCSAENHPGTRTTPRPPRSSLSKGKRHDSRGRPR